MTANCRQVENNTCRVNLFHILNFAWLSGMLHRISKKSFFRHLLDIRRFLDILCNINVIWVVRNKVTIRVTNETVTPKINCVIINCIFACYYDHYSEENVTSLSILKKVTCNGYDVTNNALLIANPVKTYKSCNGLFQISM